MIPKPGKSDYSLAKSYKVISFLNCLGKTAEKVAAMLGSARCEVSEDFHPCRALRSVVDAVGTTAARMGPQSTSNRRGPAFPSAAQGCFLRKMRNMGLTMHH